jgi:hypothetical protein
MAGASYGRELIVFQVASRICGSYDVVPLIVGLPKIWGNYFEMPEAPELRNSFRSAQRTTGLHLSTGIRC